MKKIIRIGDHAVGHTDIQGNAVTGTVSNGSGLTKIGGIGVARNGDIVTFPSHPHALDIHGNPTNYLTHSVAIIATSKHTSNNKKIALEGDVVPVADVAGGNATLVATQTKVLGN